MSSILSKEIIRFRRDHTTSVVDDLSVEEPLEIRVRHSSNNGSTASVSIAVTMRTPGDDESLARGFLFTEGVVYDQNQIIAVNHPDINIIELTLAPAVQFDATQFTRNFYASSSCGVCGKASIDSIHSETIHLPWKSKFEIQSKVLLQLPDKLRNQQLHFGKTGGIHACALIDTDGGFLDLKEDVGRHNAMDKLIGSNHDYPYNRSVILVSGRASFELIQKASKAGVGLVASIGAPSSLAVQLAEEQGITLIGFLKEKGFNIYSEKYRIKF